MKIEDTTAYKALPELSQKMVLKRVNRLQIEDAIIIARTMGVEIWKTITPLQQRWQAIVIEIVDKKEENQPNTTTDQSQDK